MRVVPENSRNFCKVVRRINSRNVNRESAYIYIYIYIILRFDQYMFPRSLSQCNGGVNCALNGLASLVKAATS